MKSGSRARVADNILVVLSTMSTALFTRCSNLSSYLQTLPQSSLATLYTHPATCLAVFRELPSLARQIVMRLLFVKQEVPTAVVTSWVTSAHKEEETAAARALTDLGVWSETATKSGMAAWRMNEAFRENLQRALNGGGDPWTMSSDLDRDKVGGLLGCSYQGMVKTRYL